MAINRPQRHPAHQLEDESLRFFHQCLPAAWTYDEPRRGNDYGIDLRIGIVTNHQITSRTLVVQLKSSLREQLGDVRVKNFRVATYNNLWDMLEVALLVKYVAEENEAYWVLFKDIPTPPQNQQTFTVRIPRTNRLSENPWPQIEAYVQDIHHRKLDAVR